mmetsp:Transcript_9472/g.20320  ORF Transcript_9472/g.20320 Transcript_9472/m.20320 type:complete len:255 (+) Transcript_9472:385-1149(+)
MHKSSSNPELRTRPSRASTTEIISTLPGRTCGARRTGKAMRSRLRSARGASRLPPKTRTKQGRWTWRWWRTATASWRRSAASAGSTCWPSRSARRCARAWRAAAASWPRASGSSPRTTAPYATTHSTTSPRTWGWTSRRARRGRCSGGSTSTKTAPSSSTSSSTPSSPLPRPAAAARRRRTATRRCTSSGTPPSASDPEPCRPALRAVPGLPGDRGAGRRAERFGPRVGLHDPTRCCMLMLMLTRARRPSELRR